MNRFPEETRAILINIREIILQNAPEAEESMSYGAWFAGFVLISPAIENMWR